MLHNPEGLGDVNDRTEAGQEPELGPEEMAELAKLYKVDKGSEIPRNVSIVGMAALAGAMAVVPQEAPAAGLDTERTAQVQQESAEKQIVREGKVNHPALGGFSFSVFRKMVDMSNPTFDGNPYGVSVDGKDMKVIKAQFLRSGTGVVKFQTADGKEATLLFPSVAEAIKGQKAEFEAAGQKVNVE